jgi:hypothetical protein
MFKLFKLLIRVFDTLDRIIDKILNALYDIQELDKLASQTVNSEEDADI